MTRKQKMVRYRWFQRVSWVALFALGFQTAAPAAQAGVETATRHYKAWQNRRAQARPAPPDVRVLRKSEMLALKGRGRIPSFAGQAKWDIIDNGVNLRTRNYTYTATDLTLPGAIGIPVSVVRTWNANDDREGPFGVGWSWSLDIRQAAGGLIKRKTSPSRTVPTQVSNGRSMPVVKLMGIDPNGQPRFQVDMLDGASCQDLSGEQWVAWRDADGLYTPPPWDHNEYESTYTTVVYEQDGEQYIREYALSTKVTTPDGTVYYYEAVLQPEGLPVVMDNAGNEVYSEQVLKWVEDRHGNRTVYEYRYEDNVLHSYYLANGNRDTAVVRKAFVKHITNASGFVLTVDWNFENGGGYDANGHLAHPRVVAIHSSDGRTVQYGYEDHNRNGSIWDDSVTTVRSPGGRITRYGYTTWQNSNLPPGYASEEGLLCQITDADGVAFRITYNSEADPDTDRYWYAVAVQSVQEPSGARTDYMDGSLRKQYAPGIVVNREFSFGNEIGLPDSLCGQTRVGYGVSEYWVTDDEEVGARWVSYMARHRDYDRLTGQQIGESYLLPNAFLDRIGLPRFVFEAEAEDVRTLPLFVPSFVSVPFLMTEYCEYNCFGQPLEIRQKGITYNSWYGPFDEFLYTQTVSYWGKEKYFQKRLEIDPKGRKVYYDYYDRNAPQGYKGQLKAVYAQPVSQFTQQGGEWIPAPGTTPISEVLEYNQHGQPVLSRALQQAGTNPRWVYTRTEYDPATGQPSTVIEDVYDPTGQIGHPNGINRIRTTTYDALGRPEVQSTYSRDGRLIQSLQTVYLDEDGQVKEVKQLAPVQRRLVEYTYTPAGRTESVHDHQSGVFNFFSYEPNTGRIHVVEEYWNGSDRPKYRWEYGYTGADLTSKTLTVNPDTNQAQIWRWEYRSYKTGYLFPLQRAFRRVVMYPPENLNVSRYPLVVDYVYEHPTFRLRAARFGVIPMDPDDQVPQESCKTLAEDLITQPLAEQCPKAFALAWYVYDPLGRLVDLRYYQVERERDESGQWLDSYRYSPMMRFEYFTADSDETNPSGYNPYNYQAQYDATGNRLRMRALDYLNGQPQEMRVEAYQYDELDRLTRVNYSQVGIGSWSDSWSYDVMGNRYGAGNPAYDGLNRLTQLGGATIQHDLLGNRLQDARYLYQWDAMNRLVQMQAYQQSGRFKVLGDTWRFGYRADGLRVFKERVSMGIAMGASAGGSERTEYLYDGQMPVMEQDFKNGVLQQTRVHFLGARGIEAVVAIDHTSQGNPTTLRWLLYDGHGNLVRTMAPDDYTLSAWQFRGVWGEVQGNLALGRGYCANLGHPEDETGLVYMRARYYEPATGRFISEDPARDGVNWYLYADGNPVNNADFTGEFLLGLASLMDVMISITELLYSRTLKDRGDIAAAQAARNTLTEAFLKWYDEIAKWLDVLDEMSDLLEYGDTGKGGFYIKNPNTGKQVHVDLDTSHHGYPHFDLQWKGRARKRLPF